MTRTRIFLDGQWQFWTDARAEFDASYETPGIARGVNVPAPWQSQSADLRDYVGLAWYRRDFEIPRAWLDSGRVILGFDAVDYFAEVWLNDTPVGAHEGGYLPFELDITGALHRGENSVTVRVDDPLEIFSEIPHGKQSWYGMLSGIWRSVWLEWRADTFLERVRVTPRGAQVAIEVALNHALGAHQWLQYEILAPDGERAAVHAAHVQTVSLSVPHPQLWELDAPNLYYARVTLFQDTATPLDSICATFGFRTIEARDGKLVLNGCPIYLRGALDQDYYPALISTAPSLAYIEQELRQAKALGLNCLRLHIKVGDERYYDAADRLGILIWTELPNWIALTEAAKRRARETLDGMLARDWNHPSIILWTLINESWGIDLTIPEQRAWLAEMYSYLKQRDPLRPVVGNSACRGNFHVATDIQDFHNYYAMPDHYAQWDAWVRDFSQRAHWALAHEYENHAAWREFQNNPWANVPRSRAPEVAPSGDEPLLVSEFGNWGLPNVEQLLAGYDNQEPWWFETGHEFRDAVVYPHGIQERFRAFHLTRAFSSLGEFTLATQAHQLRALKYQIEKMRLQASLQGYVITEFTDVHWECNGLLDMHRTLKPPLASLAHFNADDVLIADWTRLAFWSGELCAFPLTLSHYSNKDLAGSRVEWQLTEFAEYAGALTNLIPKRFSTTAFDAVTFNAPDVERGTCARLHFRLITKEGHVAAQNELELYFFPRVPFTPLRVYFPTLSNPLASLGYVIVDSPQDADVIATNVLTDESRTWLLEGARILFLAETPDALQTFVPKLEIVARHGTSWQGDWASSYSWLVRDKLFRNIPTDGVLDFGFADLTPESVLVGFSPFEFATSVHAALTVGWLHKTVALVGDRRVGRGRLLVSTFRLGAHLATHPIATWMLHEMLYAVAKNE